MIKALLGTGLKLLGLLVSSLFGALVVLIALGVYMLNSRPDLKVWHSADLDEEFTVNSGLEDFSQYLKLEERLFEQLDQLVYQQLQPADRSEINRYNQGSLSDPGIWSRNWNRSFILAQQQPKIGVLLLHGMSDSPYSLRSIGEALHQRGSYVIGMRVPGHGQAPSGLLDVQWQDMAAAVKLAIAELREKSGDIPLYIVGYSNGGALAVQYALETLADSTLVKLEGLVLLSPEIGIAKLAAMSKWLERLGHLLGLEKLAWNGLQPEYDPWKYGSFALNAGKQAYLITQQIQRQIDAQSAAGTLQEMPQILAFQSVVDATVAAPDLVNNLFNRLPAAATGRGGSGDNAHELVLFDLNRSIDVEVLMNRDPSAWINPMRGNQNLGFVVTLLSNKDELDQSVVATSRAPGMARADVCDTGLAWPEDVYSLAHVALPFPPDDPIYGSTANGPGLHLGSIALRGEKSVLQLPAADMLRLRYNPFYAYLEQRALIFMGLDAASGSACVKRSFTPRS